MPDRFPYVERGNNLRRPIMERARKRLRTAWQHGGNSGPTHIWTGALFVDFVYLVSTWVYFNTCIVYIGVDL